MAAEESTPDVANHTIKHPLNSSWTLWFDNPRTQKQAGDSWSDALKAIMEFSSVEDFWHLHASIMPASRVGAGSNYSVFKSGIKPMWEVC